MFPACCTFYDPIYVKVGYSDNNFFETPVFISSTHSDVFEELVHNEEFLAMAEHEFSDREKNPDDYVTISSLFE